MIVEIEGADGLDVGEDKGGALWKIWRGPQGEEEVLKESCVAVAQFTHRVKG